MWWWAIVVLALANALTSQPLTNDDDKYRQAREQLGIDCCPCAGSQSLDSSLRLSTDQGVDATEFRSVDALPDDVQGRVVGTGDCPCRLRTDDSEGSSSIIIPRVLRPLRPDLKPSISKEEPKPLMKPEVKLASSMLDTLKEATDEEYQDVIARDSTRVFTSDSEALLDNSTSDDGNKVFRKFISNEEEDTLVPEATNVQDSRCPHPMHTFKFSRMQSKPHLGLRKSEAKTVFNGSDMIKGASNVIENVLGLNKDLESLQLKTSPSILNLFPGGLKTILNRNNGNNIMRIPKLNRMTYKNVKDEYCGESDRHLASTKIPSFKVSPALSRQSSQNEPTNDHNLAFSKLRSTAIPSFRSQVNDMDADVSPSNVNEQFSNVDGHSKFHFKSPLSNLRLRPLRLSNFLNLKDVELIPLGLRKETKVNMPSLKLPPIKPREKLLKENIVNNSDDFEERGQVDIDSKENDVKTKILDTVPSPSENKPIMQPTTITQILVTLPNASQPLNNDPPKGIQNKNMDVNKVPTNQNKLHDISEVNFNANDTKKQVKLVPLSNSNEEAIIFEDSDSNTIIIIDENGQTTTLNHLDGSIINQSNDSDEQNDLNDYEDSGEINVDPETIIINGLPMDSEPDTTNNDFQFAMPIETENDYDENFAEQESRSQLPPVETASVSTPIAVSDALQKIKDRLDEIKAKLALTRSNNKNNDSRESKQSGISDSAILFSDISKDCNCQMKKKEPISVIDSNDNKLDSNKESNQSCDVEPKYSTDTKTIEGERLTPSDIKIGKTQSDNLFEQSCKVDQTPNQASEERQLAKSEEEDTTETNSTTEDQDEQPETTTSISELSTTETTEPTSSNTFQQPNNSIVTDPETDTKTNKENLCKISSQNQAKTQQKFDEDQAPEMSVGGSAPEPNIAPLPALSSLTPTLFNNGIVQPSSLISNDIFNRPVPAIGDLFNLNTRLPSLDDVRSEIANVLGIESRNADKLDSGEIKPDNENFNPTMFSEASTNKAKSVLPRLRPLEDLNLDIFQVRPFSQSRIPGLDLNSFKTHLALPKNLGLKPVKLQSSLGRNGGLLGATLTFGPEKIGSSRKSSSTFAPKVSKILSNSPFIPSLSELRDKMRANAEDLLSSSPFTISTIPVPSPPSLGAIHENLRTHTENTMRNLQQSLASTLNEAKTKQEKYARPKDTFEDFHDKLQALHMDFNDRLSSIHERIFDKSKLPVLHLPQVYEPKNIQSNKPIKPSNFRINKPQSNKVKEQRKIKPIKISKSASTFTPKSIEVPKLVPTSVRPPVFKSLQDDNSPIFKDMRPRNHQEESNNKLSFREQYKENRENIIKPSSHTEQKLKSLEKTSENIKYNLLNLGSRRRLHDSHGFASEVSQTKIPAPTHLGQQLFNKDNKLQDKSLDSMKPQVNLRKFTTRKPIPKLSENSNKATNLLIRKSSLSKRPNLADKKSQAVNDSLGFPSENNLKNLLKKTNLPKSISIKNTKSSKPSVLAVSKSKSITPIGKLSPSDSLKPNLIKDLRKESPLTKTTESPFLARVRDSLKSRVSTLNKSKPKNVINSQSSSANDMTISATENREISLLNAQPLKENVQYRCKMICVKEPAK